MRRKERSEKGLGVERQTDRTSQEASVFDSFLPPPFFFPSIGPRSRILQGSLGLGPEPLLHHLRGLYSRRQMRVLTKSFFSAEGRDASHLLDHLGA